MSDNADVKVYLTSIEPRMAQTIPAQSIGGYCSLSAVYSEALLTNSIGIYDTDIILTFSSNAYYDTWRTLNYISIGEEIIKINGVESDGVVNVVQRSFNGVVNMHLATDIVYAISIDSVFNDVFSSDYKQYRCMAIKNLSSGRLVENIRLYMANNNQNPRTEVKIAAEVPSSQYLTSYSSSWTNITLVDKSLIDRGEDASNVPSVEWIDNQCENAYLRILSGPNEGLGRVINSYDALTGTFTFSELPSDYDSTKDSAIIQYEVDAAPAQRLRSGVVSPDLNTVSKYTNFIDATSSYYIGVGEAGRVGGSLSIDSLNYNDVLYVWVERSVEDNSELFEDNNVSIIMYYSVT
jgi:hypothetical protein